MDIQKATALAQIDIHLLSALALIVCSIFLHPLPSPLFFLQPVLESRLG